MFSSVLFFALYLMCYGAFLLSYVSTNNSFPKPLPPKEEERCLLLAASGDAEARDRLVEHNLRLVAHIVKKYTAAGGYDSEDLISVGTIGLLKAIETFDCTKKARLATYAARCIENEIRMLMRAGRKTSQEISLSDCLGHDSDGNEVTFMDILPSNEPEVADSVSLSIDSKALYRYIREELDDREREIVVLRYGLSGKPQTQREIAKNLGISRSYVSRLEKKALKKLLGRFRREA